MKVTYLDQEFEVPEWTNYIAAESNGSVYAYQLKPVPHEYLGYCYYGVHNRGEYAYAGHLVCKLYPLQEIIHLNSGDMF